MQIKLKTGDNAPDFNFVTPWQTGLEFYKAAGENPSVLIFLRYQGCPVCQMEMASLKHEIDLFAQKDAGVFVFLQSSPEVVASAANKEDWPFTIVSDPSGDIFRLYSVMPGGILKYLHPAGLMAAIKATFKGHKHGKFEGMETQLPAAFIVGTDKTIIYAYYGKNISDVPSPKTLSDIIK